MNNITETLKECHATVWRYRAELQHVWPTPKPTGHALRFMFTEVGEAYDSELRGYPEYARNNEKYSSVHEELADAAMMGLTALGSDYDAFEFAWEPSDPTLNQIAYYVVSAMMEINTSPFWQGNVLDALCNIACYPDMDLPQRLTARLERIKAKRLPNPYPRNGTKADVEQWAYRNFVRHSWEEYNEPPMPFEEWQKWTNTPQVTEEVQI